jgi:REP element-mobilizing transposase RayT
MPDHVHICISFPPEYVLVRRLGGRQSNVTGEHL